MKCIRCGHDSKYKERSGQKCPKCRGAFAFEPRTGDRFTDQGFQSAIDAVSASGKLRWGVEHLYYEICRRWNRLQNFWVAGVFVIWVLLISLFAPGPTSWKLLAIAAVIGWMVWGRRRERRPVLTAREQFDRLWARWTATHGQPKGVIVRQPAPPASTMAAKEADVGDYSFDRAVICDRARTADLLLANNFHFEHNCAVLSIDGYPPGPFATVRAMLKRNPRLQVYTLHDATPAGCRMALKLARDREWFATPLRITDVGLRPAQVKRLKALYLPAQSSVITAGAGVTTAEAHWLSRHALELAVFRPEYILKQVFAAMTRRRDSNGSGGDGGASASAEGQVASDAQAFGGEGGEAGGAGADDSFG